MKIGYRRSGIPARKACPVCGRGIEFNPIGTNMQNEPVLNFHYDQRTGKECLASGCSMLYAQTIRSQIDGQQKEAAR